MTDRSSGRPALPGTQSCTGSLSVYFMEKEPTMCIDDADLTALVGADVLLANCNALTQNS